jgi:hypothetical protein
MIIDKIIALIINPFLYRDTEKGTRDRETHKTNGAVHMLFKCKTRSNMKPLQEIIMKKKKLKKIIRILEIKNIKSMRTQHFIISKISTESLLYKINHIALTTNPFQEHAFP